MAKKNLNVQLLIIDPQNDFMGDDQGSPYTAPLAAGASIAATLPVKGALTDMRNLAGLVGRVGNKLADIHVTLDSHRVIDVAHPGMWRDQDGNQPAPFTLIFNNDIKMGLWTPRNPDLRQRMLDYTAKLEAAGQYVLIIWPEHCLIGSWGHNVEATLMSALATWERKNFAQVNYVTKGSNPFTEHYGGFEAEVADPQDPSTQFNMGLVKVLQEADIIGVAGEASSHCVKATIEQVAAKIGDAHLSKFHLLTDCMSPVSPAPGTPDFPAIAEQFKKDMAARGMVLTTSSKFLA